MEEAFLQAILENPAADDGWCVMADWLEENGQADRAELVRLQVALRRGPRRGRARMEQRVQKLLSAGVGPCVPVVVNSLAMRLALIPPGRFAMGSPRRRPADSDEFPRHEVRITRPFLMGVHQVTQGQYERVMGSNPSYFGPEGLGAEKVARLNARKLPVDSVSFDDILEFCRRLSDRPAEKKAGRVYRLPTEAEWEYACRACMTHTPYHFGTELHDAHARFGGNGGGHPVPVGSYPPNLFGLCDMHGNVWEWCADWYEDGYYASAPMQDPIGPAGGDRRVLRGGGWSTPSNLCRSALRGHNTMDAQHNYNGFRVAVTVGKS